MRSAIISYEVTDAWEMWYIDITDPDAPEDITPEWLQENRDAWEWFDLKDRGGGNMVANTLEVEGVEVFEDDGGI